jgi:DNA-binding transcriptional MocR family regulator
MVSKPVVESITQFSSQPGLIDLAWGHPDPKLLPVEALRRATTAALNEYGDETLQYGHPAGPGPLLQWLRGRIRQQDGRAPADGELLVTGGISLGLELLLSWISAPGDTVLVESPTYHLAVRILRDRRLNLVPVPADERGLRVDHLAVALERLRQAGVPPRFLYLVPTFNNPTGASLSAERRGAVVALAAQERLLIIEDDVYRELAYDAPAPPSLWGLGAPGAVVRLGSFAKSLAPGVRLGWMTGPREIVGRIIDGGLLDSGGGLNHFSALAVAALCAAGDFDRQVARLRRAYTQRRDTLVAALNEHLPAECVVRRPGGGFFVWVGLPPGGPSAADLSARAEAAGVSYLPGERFHLEGGGRHHLRLAFSLYPPDDLAEAARRLGQVVRSA